MSSRSGAIARLVILDLAGSVVWFPFWWYTRGLSGVLNAAKNTLVYRVRSYGLNIWIRNFFVPMYGQYDWTGRLVSVFMRFVVLVGRLIGLGVEGVIYAVGIVLWVVAPPFFLAMALMNFFYGHAS